MSRLRKGSKRAKALLLSLYRIVQPAGRPFLLDLGLAVGIFCVWLALCGFEPRIAAAVDKLRLVVTTGAYRPQWALGPAVLGVVGLVLAWVRYRFFAGGPQLQERLQRATLLAAALLVLRLLALYDPLVHVFPFLTLLWSPHALWAVALVFLGYVHLPPARGHQVFRTGYIAGALLAVCLPLYFLYTLYFCQVTMLHSDEPQYLCVTQSLLHDGDMDLANNLSAEQNHEYHVMKFVVNKAPASPEGKVHSPHPIGLSAALVPAYWWGLVHWENPRLGAALFMAVLASLFVPLLFLYLTRLGAERWAALLATGLMAITGPFFYYTNQLYPEVPVLLIALVALLALVHWQVPGGSYRSWGRWEAPLLGLLTLLLCCLPFLHARYVPLGLLCGAGVLLQAWHSPRRTFALFTVGLVVVAGLYALIAFHYAFSEDWMGPLRPGSVYASNLYEKSALDIATWSISLPGHWLHVGKGLLNSSPIYFFALFGLLALARLRDRRVAVAVGLYVATAAVNGLHPKWGFGFDLPARFLMTALPVLVLGLAWGLPLLLRAATTAFFAALALVISIESVLQTLVLTEKGYDGENLFARSINHFYPIHQHFFQPGQQDMPLLDIVFWALLLAALFFRPRHGGLRWAVIAAAAFAPFVWSRSDALAARLPQSLSPYMARLLSLKQPADTIASPEYKYKIPLRLSPGAAQPDGSLHARPGVTLPGPVNSSNTDLLPGIYRLTFPGLRVEPSDGQVSGHLIISSRYAVQLVSPYGSRSSTSYPLIGGAVHDDYSLTFEFDRHRMYYIYCEYSGHGELALNAVHGTFTPIQTGPQIQIAEVRRVAYESRERPIRATTLLSNLPAGHYRVRFNLTGSTFARFFERTPAPLRTAVYAGLASPSESVLNMIASYWFSMDPNKWTTATTSSYRRPLQEGVHPPWWLSVPFAADQACELRFVLTRPQDVYVLLYYDGSAELDLTDVVLYQESFAQ